VTAVAERMIIEKGVLGFDKVTLFSCRVCPERKECEAWNFPDEIADFEEFKKNGIMPGCPMWGREYLIYIEGDGVFVELGEWNWAEYLE